MADFGNEPGLWAARAAGASAGAAISLVYLLPRSRREAAGRFFTGLSCGLIFGGPTGIWLTERMELAGRLSAAETLLAGSALASLSAWWALGALSRLAGRYGRAPPPRNFHPSGDDHEECLSGPQAHHDPFRQPDAEGYDRRGPV